MRWPRRQGAAGSCAARIVRVSEVSPATVQTAPAWRMTVRQVGSGQSYEFCRVGVGDSQSLPRPVDEPAASPRKSQTKSQRGQTSGDTQLRQATVKPGQVPIERH